MHATACPGMLHALIISRRVHTQSLRDDPLGTVYTKLYVYN